MRRAELEDLLTLVPQVVTILLCQRVVSTMRLLNYPTGLWGSSGRGGRGMNFEMLRDEYDLARRYTQSLYADLPEADVHWRQAAQPATYAIGPLLVSLMNHERSISRSL
jgi:hypothetical protein